LYLNGMVLYRVMLKGDVGNVGHGGHTHIYMHDVCISTCLLQIPCLIRCSDLMKM
jgi:hypothetical protein